MSLEAALVTIKSGNNTLNTLIGTRFSPETLGERPTLPAVVYQLISRPREYAMGVPALLAHARVQMDGYAATASARVTLSDAIRKCFDRYKGTASSTVIQDIRIDNEFETIENENTEAQAYRVSFDFIIDHQET